VTAETEDFREQARIPSTEEPGQFDVEAQIASGDFFEMGLNEGEKGKKIEGEGEGFVGEGSHLLTLSLDQDQGATSVGCAGRNLLEKFIPPVGQQILTYQQ
jgi:hypothetical protein